MKIHIFGMTFGTFEIVVGGLIIVVLTMYFMQKSR